MCLPPPGLGWRNKLFLLSFIINEEHDITGGQRKRDPGLATVTSSGGLAVTTPAHISLTLLPTCCASDWTRAASGSQLCHHVGQQPARDSQQEVRGTTPYREQTHRNGHFPKLPWPQFLGDSTVRKQVLSHFWPARITDSVTKRQEATGLSERRLPCLSQSVSARAHRERE